MECKKCGKTVKKTDAFCQYCGTKVEASTKETKPTVVKSKEKKEEVKVEKVEQKKSGNGVAIAGMVLGIIGLVLSLIIGPLAFLFTLLGLILSICGKKSGFKIAGIITSIVGIVIQILWIILIVFFASVISSFTDAFNDIDIYGDDFDYGSNSSTYKYASPYGKWTCTPYPESSYKTSEETTLEFKYSGKYIYGPTDDLDNNYYSGTFTYEKEYDKNKEYTDREFIKITAPVTEFKMNGISQDISNKNLNMEMEFINDYKEAIIMFYNTQNTYKCKK